MIRLLRLSPPVGLAALLVTGCATLDQADPILAKYPGIKTQITNYYDDKAVEDDWSCKQTDMQGIEKVQVIQDTPQTLVVGVHYSFQPEEGGRFDGGCNGFGTRVFTFTKAGAGYSLEHMSGLQR
jgi:hypothetical protein